ncbi:MAG: hypothetical protein Q9M92_02430 [Enterobacterales bacterium]|nr:hypothetical protein [Enterobacterales bacterium]
MYTEDYVAELGFTGSFDVESGFEHTSLASSGFGTTGLSLEGCDIAEIVVVPNDPPVAVGYVFSKATTGLQTQKIVFTAAASSDPNNNPLTHTWAYGNIVKVGSMTSFDIARPEFQPEEHSITLTVSDGGKSDETTFTFYVDPYCFSCNGQSAF